MATFQWIVDSEDHVDGLEPIGTNVLVDINKRLPTSLTINAIRIKRVSIPYIVHNVTANNQNLTLVVPSPGVNYPIVIPAGYYTGADLVATLNTLFAVALAATTIIFNASFSSITYLVTIDVTDPAATDWDLVNTVGTIGDTPSVLEMLGFTINPFLLITPLALNPRSGDGELNSSTDRYLLITCDEARGINTPYDHLGTGTTASPGLAWKDGVVAIIPIPETVSPGMVINYDPDDDAPWISLPIPGTPILDTDRKTLLFRLKRSRYTTFGTSYISWSMILEIR